LVGDYLSNAAPPGSYRTITVLPIVSSVPQIRPLPESWVEGPAFKKQRIEVDGGLLVETAVRIEVDEESPRVDGPSSICGANWISKTKKSKNKKKDPPL